MRDFTFSIPQDILFGEGCLKRITEILKCHNMKRVFLISDRGLERLGVVDRLMGIITEAGIEVLPFLEVESNPSVETVTAAATAYQENGMSGIIALGGGSPMDVAKSVGAIATYGGKITQYEGANRVPGPIVPLIAIPTTAGTGSEVTPVAVISDLKRNYKFSVISKELLPRHVILDPELIYSLPASVAAATGIDAFIHAAEAYVSLEANPYSDALAEQAIKLINRNIRAFVADRQNKDAAGAMMIASNFAGLAFSSARLGNVHALSHPVSAYFHVAHGVANAILLLPVMKFNMADGKKRYQQLYGLLHEDGWNGAFEPEMLLDEIRQLLKELNMPEHLSDVGVTADQIPAMAEDVMKSGGTTSNPRITTREDVEKLYHDAM